MNSLFTVSYLNWMCELDVPNEIFSRTVTLNLYRTFLCHHNVLKDVTDCFHRHMCDVYVINSSVTNDVCICQSQICILDESTHIIYCYEYMAYANEYTQHTFALIRLLAHSFTHRRQRRTMICCFSNYLFDFRITRQ